METYDSSVRSLGHRYDIQIVDADVEEARRAKGDDGRPYVTIRDDLDSEDISNRTPVVVHKQVRYQMAYYIAIERESLEIRSVQSRDEDLGRAQTMSLVEL